MQKALGSNPSGSTLGGGKQPFPAPTLRELRKGRSVQPGQRSLAVEHPLSKREVVGSNPAAGSFGQADSTEEKWDGHTCKTAEQQAAWPNG